MADAEPDSFQPPQIARQVVEIVGPTIDMTRLKALLESAFGARSVKLRATVPLELEQPPRRPKLGKLGTRIMATLADGKPWRAKHLIAEVAEGRVPATVRHEIDLLVEEERIQRPRSGIYMLAGLPPPKAEDIRPFRERSGTGSNASRNTTGKRILAMLDQPTSANRIVKELGITRQRVDQVMKALLSERQVKRIPEPGLKGRWLSTRKNFQNPMPVKIHEILLVNTCGVRRRAVPCFCQSIVLNECLSPVSSFCSWV